MHTPESVPPSSLTAAAPLGLREIISDALAYWEPRRIGYNLILAAIVDHDDLDVLVGLREGAVYRLDDESSMVVGRNDDGNQRRR